MHFNINLPWVFFQMWQNVNALKPTFLIKIFIVIFVPYEPQSNFFFWPKSANKFNLNVILMQLCSDADETKTHIVTSHSYNWKIN